MPVVYDFWYWPGIPGRGEFVRLTMEALRIEYRDCAREEGAQALIDDIKRHADMPAFAPPYLRVNSAVIAQTANILMYLRSEEHTSELQSLMRISYAVFCLKKKKYYISYHIPILHALHITRHHYTKLQIRSR